MIDRQPESPIEQYTVAKHYIQSALAESPEGWLVYEASLGENSGNQILDLMKANPERPVRGYVVDDKIYFSNQAPNHSFILQVIPSYKSQINLAYQDVLNSNVALIYEISKYNFLGIDLWVHLH